MTKLFKNSKSILSFVLAFAVLAVSLFTGVVIHSDAANCDDELNVVYITYGSNANGEPDGSFMDGTHGTGTETDPYVISTPGQLRYLAQKTTYAQTHGKFFEIDDSIDIMVLQSEAYINTVAGSLDAFLALDAEGVKTAFETTTNRAQWQSSTANDKDCFAGTLNGNGVKIVGAYNQNGGIIAYVNDGATAKNLTVEHCMFETGWFAGSIFGYSYPSATLNATGLSDENCPGVITFDNITVHDNYTKVSGNAQQQTGALFGDCANYIGVKVNGCLVYDCKLLAETAKNSGNFADHPFAFGDLSTGHNGDPAGYLNGSYTNSVFIGCAPWTYTTSNQAFKPAYYSAVYTDCAAPSYQLGGWANFDKFVGITVIGTANAKGAAAKTNMPNLDWANTWVAVDGEYPELRSNHNIKIVDNGDGTHKEACEDCGLNIGTAKHSFTAGVCACGYKAKCGEVVLYWDGSADSTLADNGEAGTADNPIIIDSAAELNYLSNSVEGKSAAGKLYYKMADGIDKVVLQPEGKLDVERLLACSGDEVYTYFNEIGLTNLVNWETKAQEMWFAGHFDGNGVTFAGMYSADNSAGLFATADGGAEFKNLAVVSSYIDGVAGNARTGAIVGGTCGVKYGAGVVGTVTFDTIMVANNYLHCYTNQSNGAIVMGACNNEDAVSINNAIVYGNASKYDNQGNTGLEDKTMHLYNGVNANSGTTISTVTNSIIFGTRPYYAWYDANMSGVDSLENVYTDQAANPYSQVEYAETDVKNIEGLAGAELKEACTGLDWTNTFMATADMPTFRAMHDAEFGSVVSNGAAGHSAACSCGLSVSLEPHKFVTDVEPAEWDSYYCEVCNYVCEHVSEEEGLVEYEGDCLTAAGYTYDCPICGYHEEAFEEIAGHTFTSKDAEAGADCQTPGTIAHKYCTSCEKNYAADADKFEPFENALTDLTGEKGECVPVTDDSGIVYGADDNNHWTTCATCGEKIETTKHTGVITPNGAAGHKVVCDVCKYESDNAEHAFGDDNKCDTCEWECTNHVWVDDGEPVEVGYMEKTETLCKKQAQKCEICGIAGPDKEIGHTTGDWEINNNWDPNKVYTCEGDGQHTEYLICTVCMFTVEEKIVTDPKTGHSFTDIAEEAPTCTTVGTIAHKQCSICGGLYATDAASDEPSANQLNPFDGSMDIAVDPENHVWIEYGEDATCEKDGVVDHKFCFECLLLVIDGEESEITIDANAVLSEFYDNYSKYDYEAYLAFVAENYADLGLELPAEYPAEDASDEEWMAFNEAYYGSWDVLYETDPTWNEAYGDYQTAYTDAILADMAYDAFVVAMEEAEVDLVVPAKGHTLTKVDEVAATYDKEGTKAHYACECGKLYSDAEGKNEVTAESLVIAKLVKEDKPAGDGSTTSPVTGESVASVAAVAALVGAAFVLVRKSKKA